MTLERRVEQLEKEVAELKRQAQPETIQEMPPENQAGTEAEPQKDPFVWMAESIVDVQKRVKELEDVLANSSSS